MRIDKINMHGGIEEKGRGPRNLGLEVCFANLQATYSYNFQEWTLLFCYLSIDSTCTHHSSEEWRISGYGEKWIHLWSM